MRASRARAAASNGRPKPGGAVCSSRSVPAVDAQPCAERRRRRAGVDDSEFKPGDMIRFLLIMELSSDLDANYKHIHTLKGIGQKTLGPWTQYEPILCVPATSANPCTITPDVLAGLNVRAGPSCRPPRSGSAAANMLVPCGGRRAVPGRLLRAKPVPSPRRPPRSLGAPSSACRAAPPPSCACGARAETLVEPKGFSPITLSVAPLAQATQPNNTGLAIFQRTARADSHHCIDTCLAPGVLRTATITIYINRVFTWCCARAQLS